VKREPHLRFPDWEDEVKLYLTSPQSPAVSIDWFAAALYCNLLNQIEGIPEEEWCYPKEYRIERSTAPEHLKILAPELILSVDQLKRKGYRLPTEAEWSMPAEPAP
jgi:formylglycine-generating enzyme required for sulfatase activity